MKKGKASYLLLSIVIQTIHSASILTNTPDEIPIDSVQVKQDAEEILHCNRELLINYGLKGYGEPTITNHPFCPAISQNCCNNEDEGRTMEVWNAEIKPIVERHYETYIHSIKYVLGYSQEIYALAMRNKTSANPTCRRASENIINLDMNIKVTKEIFQTMVAAVHKIAEVRRGFFCIMCDARTQSKLSDFWTSTNFFNRVSAWIMKRGCWVEDMLGKYIVSL